MTPQTGRTPRRTMPVMIAHLFRAGFSTDEIQRLRELRDQYPVLEYLTAAERQRLAFLRWQVETGRLRGDRE